jgi:glycine/D-amino acid oxidase-like deaminating enzyme
MLPTYLGGGIIGCTTAYYLTRHPRFNPLVHTVTILEASKIANGASGKAGGLLASWAYPSNIAGLSFDLHDQLAKEHNGAERWGYRRVRCGQLTAVARQVTDNRKLDPTINSTISLGKWWSGDRKGASVLPDDLNWFDVEAAQAYEEFADTSSTAQVHPVHFTNCMAKLAEQGGARVILGTVEHINCGGVHSASVDSAPLSSCQDLTQKKVVSLTYTDKATSEKCTLQASTVVLAAGPWTPTLLPQVQMSPLRAHSVTLRLKQPVSAYCLFTEIKISQPPRRPAYPKPSVSSSSKTVSLEIYARPNNEVYICGQGDFNIPLPSPTDVVEVSSQSCQEIIDAATSVSDELRDGLVTGRRACYLPMMDAGVRSDPLVGYTGVEGLLLATRHSCWGILNAPATGKVISELILDREVSCTEIGNLDPRKVL